MPKIPTFTSKARPTAEVGAIKSNIKIDPTKTIGGALASIAGVAQDYYIKQRDNVEKLEAKKKFYEMKAEENKVVEKVKNEADEFKVVDIYNNDFGVYKDSTIKGIQNKRVRKKVQQLFDLDQPETIYKLKKNAFSKYESQENEMYDTEQTIKASEYSLETDPILKAQKKQQRLDIAKEYESKMLKGKEWLSKELKKIETDSVIFDADKAMANKNFGLALEILKKSDKSKVDSETLQKKLLQIEKEGFEYKATSYGVNQILQGKNALLGKTIPGTTDKKILEATDSVLFNQAEKNKLNEEQTFGFVDQSFAQTGLVSPMYKELINSGYSAGSSTTFDTLADIPPILIQSVKAAEAADKLGRLNVYTTDEEETFFKNIIISKQILGMNDYQAIKNAREFQLNYDKALSFGASKHKKEMFESIETAFTSAPWLSKNVKTSNIGQVKMYANKIFDMYLAMGIGSQKAQAQVVKDLKSNLQMVDDYTYMKRDIDSFKSIGGLDQVKPLKEYIIKNKMEKGEKSDEYFLRSNGGGAFEIRSRVDIATVFDKDNKPMLYYAKDLYAINQERESKFKTGIKKETIQEQERKIQAKEQFETIFGDSTGF